jgi:hypothetical protein
MAALPVPAPANPSLSLVPPLQSSSPSPSSDEPQAVRPRVRRLVVFTGKIT